MKSATFLAAALALAAGGAHPAAGAAAANDALTRPALTVRDPARNVLLSVAWAGQRLVAVGERGLITLSDDQGQTWQQVRSPVSVTLTMVRFADDRQGVAVGHGGTVLTTQDGGQRWTLRLDGRQLAEIARQSASTPDAVAEAERLLADGPDKPFLDVVMWDARRLLAVGAYGLAFHTRDGGQTWEPWMKRLPNPRGMHWYTVRRSGNAVLLAGEQGVLARSSDDGASFQALPSPYKGSWFTAEIGPGGSLLLAGLRGHVWRSAEGQQWSAVSLPGATSILASTTDAQGSTWLASQSGSLFRLQGEVAQAVPARAQPMPAGLLAHRDGRLTVVGVAGAQQINPATPTGGRP
ncbi:hypothetical protein PSQ40_04120 [Curvibacter sp. HBC61]|uniref:Photosynthesis system II assembly factor Ycf48/Hcf136-like domain-containing protein n=1 Tax=Curvibacter cyanobacteriorum TaxID=3026422 RepID=A0ABT5MV83_9BURK|nr:hypothetical protein [Curvibacter sp. HBC61]MDD0837752.1 hypothetical protein [Curvibacter sp. HBC61]